MIDRPRRHRRPRRRSADPLSTLTTLPSPHAVFTARSHVDEGNRRETQPAPFGDRVSLGRPRNSRRLPVSPPGWASRKSSWSAGQAGAPWEVSLGPSPAMLLHRLPPLGGRGSCSMPTAERESDAQAQAQCARLHRCDHQVRAWEQQGTAKRRIRDSNPAAKSAIATDEVSKPSRPARTAPPTVASRTRRPK
jgi:hypothetical protein